MNARVARLLAPRELVFQDEAITPNAIVAETLVSAVSVGTERAAYVGDPPLRPGKVYPRLVGYCNVATVTSGALAGKRILTHQSHRNAFSCAESDVLAIVPQGVDPAEASVTYLAHLGLAALRRVGHVAGERVTVIGLGAIGLATIAVARALGSEVIAIGNAPSRIALAEILGGRSAEDATPIVVNTANTWEAHEEALKRAAKFGRIAVLGFPGRTAGPPKENPLASQYFYDKQLAIFGTGMPPTDDALTEGMRMLVGLLESRKLNLAPLITDRAPWSSLGEIYERAAKNDKTLVTAVLDWRTT